MTSLISLFLFAVLVVDWEEFLPHLEAVFEEPLVDGEGLVDAQVLTLGRLVLRPLQTGQLRSVADGVRVPGQKNF